MQATSSWSTRCARSPPAPAEGNPRLASIQRNQNVLNYAGPAGLGQQPRAVQHRLLLMPVIAYLRIAGRTLSGVVAIINRFAQENSSSDRQFLLAAGSAASRPPPTWWCTRRTAPCCSTSTWR